MKYTNRSYNDIDWKQELNQQLSDYYEEGGKQFNLDIKVKKKKPHKMRNIENEE